MLQGHRTPVGTALHAGAGCIVRNYRNGYKIEIINSPPFHHDPLSLVLHFSSSKTEPFLAPLLTQAASYTV